MGFFHDGWVSTIFEFTTSLYLSIMTTEPDKINQQHAQSQIRKDLFISFLALISVAIGLVDLSQLRTTTQFTWYDILDIVIVGIFIIDFIWSAAESGDWRSYVKRHWYELPSLIPITGNMVLGAEAIPLLRSLRLIRLVRVLRLLRVVGAAARIRIFWRTASRIARRAHLDLMILLAIVVIFGGAGIAWLIESKTNEHFNSFGDSLWWAVNMFSNVAYVDFHPATLGGRIVAMLLEFMGIAFIGLFTASLAKALLTDKPENEENSHPLE
jgi:voltage-gated potassium channel